MTLCYIDVRRVSLLVLSSYCWITAHPCPWPPMPKRLLVRSRSHMLGVRPCWCWCWMRRRFQFRVRRRQRGLQVRVLMSLVLLLHPVHRYEEMINKLIPLAPIPRWFWDTFKKGLPEDGLFAAFSRGTPKGPPSVA